MEQKLVITLPIAVEVDLTNLNPTQRAIAMSKRIVKQPAPNASPDVPFDIQAGFTPLQLKTLRDQIFAFKSLKKNDISMELYLVAHAGNTQDAQRAFIAWCSSPAGKSKALQMSQMPRVHQPNLHQHQQPMYVQQPQQRFYQPQRTTPQQQSQISTDAADKARNDDELADHNRALKMGRMAKKPVYFGPSLATATYPVTPQVYSAGIMLGPHPLKGDIGMLMRREADKLVGMQVNARRQQLEDQLAAGLAPCEKAPVMYELRGLRLLELQKMLRAQVDRAQDDVMAMGERQYKKFARETDAARESADKQANKKKALDQENHVKALTAVRAKMREAATTARARKDDFNKKVQRFHNRMAQEHGRGDDSTQNTRLDALRSNDIEAYMKMLQEASKKDPGDQSKKKYEQLTSFLSKTEEYLNSLGSKISMTKVQETLAQTDPNATEEEVREDAERILANAAKNKNLSYYNAAHSEKESIREQPRMLTAGKLREYQIVGLQWMISLYNNKLNGILADEMGLGKTVQVMALVAYLMESKNNVGPHLIIVPNAVVVNWKSEIKTWLPNINPVYYLGSKDVRNRIFQTEVLNGNFNVLVTTFEYIMRDRSKLSKVDWRYIIIDEAQRMKDRESRLSRDLDRFKCERRLLLTGTPLQNDLAELWALLNLLLPQVFDSKTGFNDWFGNTKATPSGGEDDWLEMEKRVIVISRLHQILEPFMLRRMVEDVESRLPKKIAVTLQIPMSAMQSSVYEWVRRTATLRIDPSGVSQNRKVSKLPYAPLQNKVMELRKLCNHVLLSYPQLTLAGGFTDEMVRCSGKFWVLDQMLVKLFHTKHRILLFSTMTRLLDLVEQYLQWREITGGSKAGQKMKFCRIDGCTPLEQREEAINQYNAPDSDKFIFLLSIRAAGRGLNLQTSDTVIIYDPDPNPKNEEQAIARSHRIGQKREVRVFHFEAAADTAFSEGTRVAAAADAQQGAEPDKTMGSWGGCRRDHVDSIESMVRNNIQKAKMDMAEEVIDAGRFDQQTTQEERRGTLESLLQGQQVDRNQAKVPDLEALNKMIARDDDEVALFSKLDRQLVWPQPMLSTSEMPTWMQFDAAAMNQAEAMSGASKEKSGRSKKGAGMSTTDVMMLTETLGRGMRVKTVSTGSMRETDDDDFLEDDDGEERTPTGQHRRVEAGGDDYDDEEEAEEEGLVEVEEEDDDSAEIGYAAGGAGGAASGSGRAGGEDDEMDDNASDDDVDAADEDDDFTSAGKKVTFAKRGSGGSEETTGFEGPPRKRWREE